MAVHFILPFQFTESHQQTVYRYLDTPESLSPDLWATLFEAMDTLRLAMVSHTVGQQRTFASLYHTLVDLPYADGYIATLLDAADSAKISTALWAAIARRIQQDLRASEFFDARMPECRLLSGYLLYWWQQFARGYAFEIEVFRDLAAGQIVFQAHDLRARRERLSPFDLRVSAFCGDIKTSLYFLAQQRHPDPDIDFYITRAWLPAGRVRTLVVFLKPAMWKEIDGDTRFTTLDKLEQVLPQPGAVCIGYQTVVVADYALWKAKIRRLQEKERNHDTNLD